MQLWFETSHQCTPIDTNIPTAPTGLEYTFVVAEFSSPTFKPFRTIYINYLMKALPAIASKTSSNPDAYVYLAESIRAWPDQAALAARITQAGWSQVGWRNLSGGVVAVHRAINS